MKPEKIIQLIQKMGVKNFYSNIRRAIWNCQTVQGIKQLRLLMSIINNN